MGMDTAESQELVFNRTINSKIGDRYSKVERRRISVTVMCY